MKKSRRRWLIKGMVVGALFTAAPLLGLLGTVIGMIGAFQTLGSSGIADPHELSSKISVTLFSTATGLFLCPFGIILLALSIVFYVNDRKAAPPLPSIPKPGAPVE